MYKISLAVLLIAVPLAAQTPATTAPASATPVPGASPLRFSVENIDRSADPCTDFYQYACGAWMKNNPIPQDQSRWGRFAQLQERNRDILHQILEESAKPGANRDQISRQIGDYYFACMDEKGIDARGLRPIQPLLDRIRNLKDKSQLAQLNADLEKQGMGSMFDFSSGPDFKDSRTNIAQADQGGLGLPDRDFYLRTDSKSVQTRQQYLAHVARMFELMGDKPDAAKAHADTVMRIETALAKGSLDNVSRRDPEKVYHVMTKQELQALTPLFNWNEFLTATGAPSFEKINVAWPDFFKAMNAELQDAPLDDWKTYFTWHLLHSEAPLLPTKFVNENFNFYGKTLTGAPELRSRWKRCVDYADSELGEALGQKFVERAFGKEGKERTQAMVDNIEKAMGENIRNAPWMSEATKQKALVKLHAIVNKIGYPNHWRDYSSVVIKRDDPLGNSARADQFEFQRQLNKIGKPVDRQEWDMTPPTVNAYYDPLNNDINFPAGILQPPFYEIDMPDAVNYGGIGMVIGHELTHGFDDEGSQFGPDGNLENWWTPEDKKAFDEREACFVKQYSAFTVEPDLHVNGKLTLGENSADNGGARISLHALDSLPQTSHGPEIGGYTPDQQYFLSFAQIWCANERPEAVRLQVQTDPHSPPRFRVNGVVQNMEEFRKAFSCKVGQPMAPANTCRVW